MVKRFLPFLFTLILGVYLFQIVAQAEQVQNFSSYYRPEDDIQLSYVVDASAGVLTLRVDGTPNDINVRIAKDGIEYLHHISSEEPTTIPLTMGSGEYLLEIRMYITATLAETLGQTTFLLDLKNPMAPWLSASRIINWTPEMELTQKARSLVVKNNQKSTALAFCDYIAERYAYNNSVWPPPTYLPDLELVYQDNQGICYDFAALYTAMCRSVGIPARLVMGYSDYMGRDKYHAWCQVYIDGQWLTVDPTYSMTKDTAFLDASYTTAQKYY